MLCSVIVLRIGKTRVQAQCRVGLDNPIFREKSDHLSAQLPIPTQLAKFSSRIPTPHNTTTAPIPLHLGSNNTDCCASAIALWTVVHGGGGLTVAAASGIFMGKDHPPTLVLGSSKCPLPIGDPSIARPARCPERPVRSRGSRTAGGGRALRQHKFSTLSDHHQSKNWN